MQGWLDRQVDRKWAGLVVGVALVAALSVSIIAGSESESEGQIVPGPPTTPQPTVPCTPPTGCGRAGGTQRDVAFAWIDRYCNGDAVAVQPGFTMFAVNYGLGGQFLGGPVQFDGVALVNGAVFPTLPLDQLNPGEKDTRIREVEIPNGAVVEFILTGTVVATGAPVIWGNGTDVRTRIASGACADAPAVVPPPADVPPAGTVPPFTSLPPGSKFPEVL